MTHDERHERIAEIRCEIHALYESGRRDELTLNTLQRLHDELTRLIEEAEDA